MSTRFVFAAIGALACFTDVSAHAQTFSDLAHLVPRHANALVLMDVEKILAAPLAQKQGWAHKLEMANVDRPIVLPPEAKKLALGALLTREDDFRAFWQLAVIETAEPISVRSMARAEGGHVEQLHDISTAFLPRGVAVASLSNTLTVAVQPSARQFVARWLASTRIAAEAKLSPYLESSLSLVNDRVQMLLAIDLGDAMSPYEAEETLRQAAWLKGKEGQIPEIVKLLGSLRGAALRVAIADKCNAQVQIDFGADVAPLGDLAKPLVMEALTAVGMPTAELEKWDISLADRSIRLRGDLSTDAQRRLFSVIQLPAADLAPDQAANGATANPPQSEVRDRSQAYFASTQVLLKDLRKGLKDTKATSAWMERYARSIDNLPVLNVDEQLLDYGDKLAETLRIMSLSKRQAGIEAGVRATEGRGYYDGYTQDAYSRAADRSQATKEVMADASDVRVQGWQLIDDATADIRKALTKKYGVEF